MKKALLAAFTALILMAVTFAQMTVKPTENPFGKLFSTTDSFEKLCAETAYMMWQVTYEENMETLPKTIKAVHPEYHSGTPCPKVYASKKLDESNWEHHIIYGQICCFPAGDSIIKTQSGKELKVASWKSKKPVNFTGVSTCFFTVEPDGRSAIVWDTLDVTDDIAADLKRMRKPEVADLYNTYIQEMKKRGKVTGEEPYERTVRFIYRRGAYKQNLRFLTNIRCVQTISHQNLT